MCWFLLMDNARIPLQTPESFRALLETHSQPHMNHYGFPEQECFTPSRVLHIITVPLANLTLLCFALYPHLLARLFSSSFSLSLRSYSVSKDSEGI